MVKNLPAMQETGVQPLSWEDSLEEEMATHSNILVWRIPWTEEPDRLQFKRSQRVRHNWVTTRQTHYFCLFNIYYGLPHRSVGKESTCNAGDPGLIPGSGRPPWRRKLQPTLVLLLENPMDRGAWQATVHGVTRVRHDLVTKPPPPMYLIFVLCFLCTLLLLPYFRS